MGKHTDGPWKVNNVFLDNEPNRYIVSEDKWGGMNIADCGLSGQGEWDTNEANARLIAASPDLLSACKNAFSSLSYYATVSKRKWTLRDQNSFNALEKAIAKAEGK